MPANWIWGLKRTPGRNPAAVQSFRFQKSMNERRLRALHIAFTNAQPRERSAPGPEAVVTIRAVGLKDRNRALIAGEEIEL